MDTQSHTRRRTCCLILSLTLLAAAQASALRAEAGEDLPPPALTPHSEEPLPTWLLALTEASPGTRPLLFALREGLSVVSYVMLGL